MAIVFIKRSILLEWILEFHWLNYENDCHGQTLLHRMLQIAGIVKHVSLHNPSNFQPSKVKGLAMVVKNSFHRNRNSFHWNSIHSTEIYLFMKTIAMATPFTLEGWNFQELWRDTCLTNPEICSLLCKRVWPENS